MSTAIPSTWGLQRPQSSLSERIEQLRLPVDLLCAPEGPPLLQSVGNHSVLGKRATSKSAAGVASSCLLFLVYEWAASRASALLAPRSGSAAHSVRTRRPGPNSDVSTRQKSTVGTRLYRRVRQPTPLQTLTRAALRLGADSVLLCAAILSLLIGERRSSVQSTSSQRFFVLPLPFRRCRASSVSCLRVCERTPSQRALLVWVGRHLLVLRLRTVGAIASSCNRWSSRS